jgi:SAM-dependent methyltransferase
MEFLAARGFDAHGLDPSEEACSAARRRGLQNIHQGTLGKHDLPTASFDAITAIHCMEHDPNPRAFVAGATHLLKPGGWLGITIPNIASWEARHARGEWFHLDPPYHLCLPSPRAVRETFAVSGLNDLRVRCPSFDYCQSLLYATGWRRDLPLPLTAAVLPFAAAFNLALALDRQAGTIEYWGHLGRDDGRSGSS